MGAELDLTLGELELTFSETIRSISFRPESITLLSSNDTDTAIQFNLTGGSFNSGPEFDSTVISFTLVADDILEIQAREDLANSSETSYILYTPVLARDLANNPAELIPPFQVTRYVPDMVDPDIFNFLELDLTLRQLVVEFNEPVDITTANASYFTLQEVDDNELGASESITLTGGAFIYRDPVANQKRVLVLQLNAHDYREIVLNNRIGTSILSTHISLPVGAVFDFAGNPLVNIPPSDGRVVQQLIPDNTIPMLLMFDLDINTGTFTLEFDNVMNPDRLDPTAITIQDAALATVSYRLTGGSTNSRPDYIIEMNITANDLNEIKRITGIATNDSNTYITIDAHLIDSFGGTLIEYVGGVGTDVLSITDGSGLQVRGFTPDITDPELVKFDLDLNRGELILTFSETVNASSFDLTEILLQNADANATRGFSLTSRSPPPLRGTLPLQTMSTSDDSTVITITLGFDDMNDIKRFTDLAIDNLTTYISFPNTTILDMNDNPVVSVQPYDARMVDIFTADLTPPELVDFLLDVNMSVLQLVFT